MHNQVDYQTIMRTLAKEIYQSNSFSKLPELSFSDFLWIQPLQQAMSLLPQYLSVTILYVYFYLVTLLLPLTLYIFLSVG